MLRMTSVAQIKRSRGVFLLTFMVPAFLCLVCYGQLEASAGQVGTDDFYAYYTKRNSSDSWQAHSRTGKYADIVVRLGAVGEMVFWRGSSYLPCWETEKGKWYFDEIVHRKGDGGGRMPDKINRYSYSRIIKRGPEKVVIHWRYMSDFSNVGFDGVVDEYYTITPNGQVTRKIRRGTPRIDRWNDPANVTTQTLKLTSDGIEVLSVQGPTKPALVSEPVGGSPVKTKVAGTPAAYWKFDEGLGPNHNVTAEELSGERCEISGHKTLWKKGISGTALEFDGYYSAVTLPPGKALRIKDGLTVEAWIALGAYPFYWAPVVHQSVWDKSGYYLGIDQDGRCGFHVSVDGKWESVVCSERLDLFRWYHIAAAFDKRSGKMTIYVDGAEKSSKDISKNNIKQADEQDLMIGLNSQKMPPIAGRIRKGKWPSLFGIDGLIDEVRIYNVALGSADVSQSYTNFKPGRALRDNPDMDERHFPANSENRPAEKFGAEYTKLKYYETWDNMWRVSEHPDVVVKFDELPVRMAFWRGLSHGIGLVTENGKWVGDQSSENYKEIGADAAEGCCEFMSDKQCRHAHVRIIENTDARVVVHWRYGMVDSRYIFPDLDKKTGWGDWADEYWTIYPDGVGVRHLERGWIWADSWVETMFYSEPGTKPEDNVQLEAYTLVNLAGESRTYSWADGSPECDLANPIISMVNSKSHYRPFNVYPTGSSVKTFGGHSRNSHFHWWNHFPVSQIISDGRGARAADRAAHSSLVWGTPSTNYLMYGLTNKPAVSLINLAKSWNMPASIVNAAGCSSEGYIKEQRAYVLTKNALNITFKLFATDDRPAVNPCFVIKNWGSNPAVSLKINGKIIKPGPDFRQGVVRDTDGTQTMVIWVKDEITEDVRIAIEPNKDVDFVR